MRDATSSGTIAALARQYLFAPQTMAETPALDNARRDALPLRRLLGATGLFAGATLLSRLLGMVREMVVAHRFGAGQELDAFNVAQNLPFLLGMAVQGIAMGSLIPVISRYLQKGSREEATRVSGTILTLVLVVSLVAALGGIVLARPAAGILAPGFDARAVDLTAALLRLLAPYFVFAGIGGVLACIVLAHQRFLAPAAAHVVPNVVIITVLVALAAGMGVRALAIGVTLGGLAYLLVLLAPTMKLLGTGRLLDWAPRHPGVQRVAVLALPLLLPALGAPAIISFEMALLSDADAGQIAALNYAQSLVAIPVGLLASSLGTVLLPMLSWDASSDDRTRLARRTSIALRFILMTSILAIALLCGLARLAVKVLYGSGAFDATAAVTTTGLVLWLSPTTLGASLMDILTKTYHATQNTLTPALIWLAAVMVRGGLGALLSPAMGGRGVALARSVSMLGQAAWLGWGAARIARRPLARDAYRLTATCLIVGGLIAVGLVQLELALPLVYSQGRGMAALWLALLVGLSTALYTVVVLAFNPRERAALFIRIRGRMASQPSVSEDTGGTPGDEE